MVDRNVVPGKRAPEPASKNPRSMRIVLRLLIRLYMAALRDGEKLMAQIFIRFETSLLPRIY